MWPTSSWSLYPNSSLSFHFQPPLFFTLNHRSQGPRAEGPVSRRREVHGRDAGVGKAEQARPRGLRTWDPVPRATGALRCPRREAVAVGEASSLVEHLSTISQTSGWRPPGSGARSCLPRGRAVWTAQRGAWTWRMTLSGEDTATQERLCKRNQQICRQTASWALRFAGLTRNSLASDGPPGPLLCLRGPLRGKRRSLKVRGGGTGTTFLRPNALQWLLAPEAPNSDRMQDRIVLIVKRKLFLKDSQQ